MKLTFAAPFLACSAFAAVIATQPSTTLFENDQVKVSRALERAHVKGGFHEHKPNRVMVYLQDGQQRFEYQDGRKPAVFNWKAGQVVWSPAEGMHSPEVTGDNPFNIIEVELKHPGPGTAFKGKIDAKHLTVEFENPQVRVLRLKLAPHEKVKLAGETNAVAIYLTDTAGHKNGEALSEPAGPGVEENGGTQPEEMIIIQLKS